MLVDVAQKVAEGARRKARKKKRKRKKTEIIASGPRLQPRLTT